MRALGLFLCLIALGCGGHGSFATRRAKGAASEPGVQREAERVLVGEGTARLPIDADSAFVLVDVPTGQRLITQKDAFITGMSALDRKLRTGVAGELGDEQLLAHFAAQVRPFRPEHVARLRVAAAKIAEHVAREKLALALGGDVPIVLTSGLEEAGNKVGVAYTRDGVVYLNERALDDEPTYLLSHELFHVFSHRHPEAREALYAAIGFHRLKAPIAWPKSVEARRVSSPDAPLAEHAIRVRYEGKSVLAAYVCLTDVPESEANLLDQVSTYYVLLEGDGDRPLKENAVLANYHFFENFFEQVGHNTGYLAGPEEILADNFQLLLEHPERARTPALLDQLRKVMSAP